MKWLAINNFIFLSILQVGRLQNSRYFSSCTLVLRYYKLTNNRKTVQWENCSSTIASLLSVNWDCSGAHVAIPVLNSANTNFDQWEPRICLIVAELSPQIHKLRNNESLVSIGSVKILLELKGRPKANSTVWKAE
jgi:hypothetical protein